MRPEEGISAIQVAARAIDTMQLLRIDQETTANIGLISGGIQTNIVCERVELKGEVRSLSHVKLEKHTEQIKKALADACTSFNAKLELTVTRLYPTYKVAEDDPLVRLAHTAAVKAGLEPKAIPITAGCDCSQLNALGIKSVSICVGPKKAHTSDEHIDPEDMYETARFVAAIIAESPMLA